MNNVWTVASRFAAAAARCQRHFEPPRCGPQTRTRACSSRAFASTNTRGGGVAGRESAAAPSIASPDRRCARGFSECARAFAKPRQWPASRPPARPKAMPPTPDAKPKPEPPASDAGPTPADEETAVAPKGSSLILEKHLVPGQPFDRQKIREIFGNDPKVGTELGNFILTTIHVRRNRGTLIELGVRPYNKRTAWSEASGMAALEWLREHHPVDEGLAAAVFAENEVRRLEQDMYLAKAVRWGILKPRENPEDNEVSQAEAKGKMESGQVYGKSMIQEYRERSEKAGKVKIEQYEKLRADIKEADRMFKIEKYVEMAKLEGKTVTDLAPSGDIKDVVVPVEYKGQDISVYAKKSLITDTPDPPQMSVMERLFPSTLVTIVTVALCTYYAYIYQPPALEDRLFPDLHPAVATCLGIIAVNLAVWLVWKFPPAWRFMNQYFYLIPGYPYAMSILGNTISHQQLTHLASNMFWLFAVGTQLHEMIGRGNFLALYIGTSALASWASLTGHVARNFLVTTTLGASGAINGIVGAWLYLNRDFASFKLPYLDDTVLHVDGWVVIGVFVCVEAARLLLGSKKQTMDHMAHLGGMFAGIAAARYLQWRSQVHLPSPDRLVDEADEIDDED